MVVAVETTTKRAAGGGIGWPAGDDGLTLHRATRQHEKRTRGGTRRDLNFIGSLRASVAEIGRSAACLAARPAGGW